MELSLVIPVWNDLPGLDRLLTQVATFDLFSEIIVADDASDVAPSPDTVPSAAAFGDQIVWLRSDRQRGAGHARNMALDHIRGSHVIFFDSDDLFHKNFVQIAALAASEAASVENCAHEGGRGSFDFLIFRHDDSRILDQGQTGTFASEEAHWRAIGAGGDATGPELVTLNRMQASRLCQLSAYPWNKIYRTAFLRDNDIRCTELMVHNDLELHWNSFVSADKIIACRLRGAVHFVAQDGCRLTNRRSAERLEVFVALKNVLTRIGNHAPEGRLGFLQPMVRFSWDLIDWIGQNIDVEHRAELDARAQRFFLQNLDRNRMTLLAHADPALATRIIRFIQRGSWQ
ncbi:glycosyltransferase family 2 protein [Cereibacter sphaeroides]|uniref:glycosyltransferase family 2 protein n=1 Tax=Cereibacter sphaeroides TaxID=1063 RepID=UPI001F17ABC8|nr:glycosyltransferase family A protein [Cereibacter sphaeroides]MCE6967239.1 glycosyltransferase family 2 protein [Cereibacter sphaeroides]